jgi:hypothetical protein
MLTALYGMAYFWDIHHLWYFLFVQVVAGLYQARHCCTSPRWVESGRGEAGTVGTTQ